MLNIIDERHEINMRKYYVDNIRWIIILLLVPYHAAMAWNVWGEPNYICFESNKIISSIVVFFSPYFMPLMFFIELYPLSRTFLIFSIHHFRHIPLFVPRNWTYRFFAVLALYCL